MSAKGRTRRKRSGDFKYNHYSSEAIGHTCLLNIPHVFFRRTPCILTLGKAVSISRRPQSAFSAPTDIDRRLAEPQSVSCKAAVNRQGHAEHEAGARTAEPENRRGDLVGTAQPGDWLIAHDLLDGVRPHSPSHGCIDHARAHGIDPNATRRIVHGGALCQPDYSMLGRVIGSPARLADEAAKRGTVDNGAAALSTHLEQLVFHTGPDTAQIDGDHVVEGTRGFSGQIAQRTQDTGIVERHVQLTEGGN